MKSGLAAQLILGATLFSTPGMKSGVQVPGLMSIVTGLLLVFFPLLLLSRRRGSKPGPSGPDPGDGWGNGPDPPDTPRHDGPRGGIPLADASQSKVRLRAKGRLTEKLPAPKRRPAREPERAPDRERT